MKTGAHRDTRFSRTAHYGLWLLGVCFVALSVAGGWRAPVGSAFVLLLAVPAGLAIGLFLPGLTRRYAKISPRLLLCIALAVTLVSRAVWLLLTRTTPIMDFRRMYDAAAALSSGTGIPSAHYISIFPHTLGYPLFLSPIFRLFGASVRVAQGFNAALSLLCCGLIFVIGRRAGGRWGGFIAALVWALLPAQVLQTSLVCNEILHLSLMLAAIALFLAVTDAKKARPLPYTMALWAALGLVVGLSSMVRPIGPIFLLAFALCYLVFSPSPFGGRGVLSGLKKLLPLAVMVAVFCGVSALFTIWAEDALGYKTAGAAMGWNLYAGMNAESRGQWSLEDQAVMDARMDAGLSAAEIQNAFLREGLDRLAHNVKSGAIFSLAAAKYARLWSRDHVVAEWFFASRAPEMPLNLDTKFDDLATWCNAGWFVLLGLAGAALVRTLRGGNGSFRLPVTILCGLVIAFLILEGNPRYHFPANALLCLCAAGGWRQLKMEN